MLGALKAGESIGTVVEKAIKLFEDHQSTTHILLRQDDLSVPLLLADPATDGQRQGLLSLYGGCLNLIFRLVAELLLQASVTEGSDIKILDHPAIARSLVAIIQIFDRDWRKLRRDKRVQAAVGLHRIKNGVPGKDCENCHEGKPDLWCTILQARALLSLALARACLSPLPSLFLVEVAELSHSGFVNEIADVARGHVDSAKGRARWVWWNRLACTKSVKHQGVLWQDWFWPIVEVVAEEVSVWESQAGWAEELTKPLFTGTSQIELRLKYLLDASVAEVYTYGG